MDHNTSYVERHNLTVRMGNRRYARMTNAFSKKFTKHQAMMHLWITYYSFCWIHGTLKMTPAIAAGISDKAVDYRWLESLVRKVGT